MKGMKQASFLKDIKQCVLAVGLNMLLITIGSLGIALCINSEYLNINSCTYATMILRFLCAFITAFIFCKTSDMNDFWGLSLLAGGILCLDICAGAVLFRVDPSALGWGTLSLIGGEIAAVVVCRTTKKHVTRRKRRKSAR